MKINHIGVTIKELCRQKKIKISALAEFLAITPAAVYDIFKKPNMKNAQLERVAEFLQMNSNDILKLSMSENLNISNNSDDKLFEITDSIKRLSEQYERQTSIIENLTSLLMQSGVRAKFKMYTRAS